MDEIASVTDPWWDIDAPMLAETFGSSATGFGDSWFDTTHDQHEPVSLPLLPKDATETTPQNSEPAASDNGNASSPYTTKKAKSYDIITVGKEREFFGEVQADEMPKPIKETPDINLETLTSPRRLGPPMSARLEALSISSRKKSSGLKSKAELRFHSPATGLRITSVKAVTSPKPFNFSKRLSRQESFEQSVTEKKSEVLRSTARNNSTGTFGVRQVQTGDPKRANQPSHTQHNGEARKGTKLEKQQNGDSSSCKVVKPRLVVRSALADYRQFRKNCEPKPTAVHSSNGSGNVLKGTLRQAEQSKGRSRGVSSEAFPPVTRAEILRNVSKPPLPDGSARQKQATKEAVGCRPPMAKSTSSRPTKPRCVSVTQVKPFTFETDKRHERYLKAKEEQASGRTNVETSGFQRQTSAPNLKKTAKICTVPKAASFDRLDKRIQELGGHKNLVAAVKTTNLKAATLGSKPKPVHPCGRITVVKPFLFETQKRHDQKMAALSKVTKEDEGQPKTCGNSASKSRSTRAVPGIANKSTQSRILPLKAKQIMEHPRAVQVVNPGLVKKEAESLKPKVNSSDQQVVNGMND